MANWQEIGAWDCIVEASNKTKNCVVLFHGYGADASDLHPLADFLNSNEETTWIFPQGPMEIIVAPGMKGRAWFQIDIQSMEQAMMRGQYRDLTQARPEGMDLVVDQGLEFLEQLQNTYERVIIGGFSQGSMLATELTLRAKKKPNSLIILSGALLDAKNWKNWAKDLNGISLFQSHGDKDALLDPKQAILLFQMLKAAGMSGKMYQFKGGHEIPPQILAELRKFLN